VALIAPAASSVTRLSTADASHGRAQCHERDQLCACAAWLIAPAPCRWQDQVKQAMAASHLPQFSYGAPAFVLVFLAKERYVLSSPLLGDPRRIVSACAGKSAAYVFVRLMPELNNGRQTLAVSASAPLRYEGVAIYLVALLGFLAFNGLEQLHHEFNDDRAKGRPSAGPLLHISGFAVHVGPTVRGLQGGTAATLNYVLTMTLHSVAVDSSLRKEWGAVYQDMGRFILAGTGVLGWSTGILLALPEVVVPFVHRLHLGWDQHEQRHHRVRCATRHTFLVVRRGRFDLGDGAIAVGLSRDH
jgi:hypothetical protein